MEEMATAQMQVKQNVSFLKTTQIIDATPFKVSRFFEYILLAVSSICLLISLYLLICMAIFIKRKHNQQLNHKTSLTNKLNASSYVGSPNMTCKVEPLISRTGTFTKGDFTLTRSKLPIKSHKDHSVRAAQAMHYVLLITVSLNFLRCVCEQLLFYVGNSSDEACALITKIIVGITGFSVHGCFVFLWFRQYVFYSNPLLQNIRPKALKWLSIATYVEMVFTVLTCIVIHVLWRDYTAADGVCRPLVGSRRISAAVTYGVLVASTVTIQMSLTFLFVYPITNHNKQMKLHREKYSLHPELLQKFKKSATRLLECVKRALVAATVAVTTDTIGGIVGIWTAEAMPLFLFSVLYELDVLFNILCLFYTYVHWKDIVFPWRKSKEKTHDKLKTKESNRLPNMQ